MSRFRIGAGGWLGIAEETDYGTPVNRTHWLRSMRNLAIAKVIERAPVTMLSQPGEAAPVEIEQYDVSRRVEGSVETLVGWEDGTPLLLKHLFGGVTTTGASAPYTHTYRLATAPNRWLTMEQRHGDGGAAAKSEVTTGGYFPQWTLTQEVGQPLLISATVGGRDSGGLASASTPTFAAAATGWFYHNHLTTKTFDSADLGSISRIQVDVNKSLEGTAELGSLTPTEPHLTGTVDVGVTVVSRWATNAMYTAYEAGATANLVFTWNNADGKVLTLTIRAQVVGCEKTVSGAGVVEMTTTFKGLGLLGTANAIMSCTLQNTQATPEAVAA